MELHRIAPGCSSALKREKTVFREDWNIVANPKSGKTVLMAWLTTAHNRALLGSVSESGGNAQDDARGLGRTTSPGSTTLQARIRCGPLLQQIRTVPSS